MIVRDGRPSGRHTGTVRSCEAAHEHRQAGFFGRRVRDLGEMRAAQVFDAVPLEAEPNRPAALRAPAKQAGQILGLLAVVDRDRQREL